MVRHKQSTLSGGSHDWSATGGQSSVLIERTIILLERIGDAEGPLGVSALARMTSMPKTSTYRLLKTLATHRVLSRQGGGYVIGGRLRELARVIHRSVVDDLRDLLRPYLVELYERTGDAVTLGVLDSNEVVIVDSVRGLRHRRLAQPYPRAPAHCSAIGKLLMAHHYALATPPPTFVTLVACTPHTITDWPRLASELRRIHRLGIAISYQEQLLGVVEIAMPIIGRHGPVAAVARSYPISVPHGHDAQLAHREIAAAASSAIRAAVAEERLPWSRLNHHGRS